MKSEFMAAITQLSSERNLPKEVVLSILEAALASAYKKGAFSPEQDISVKINSTGIGVIGPILTTLSDLQYQVVTLEGNMDVLGA